MRLNCCSPSIVFALIIISASTSASAGTLTSFRANDWKGFAYSDDARQFERCSATNKASGGTSVTYSVDRQLRWSLRLSNPTWTFTKGAEVNLILKIDDLEPVNGRTAAIEKDTLEFVSRDPVRFFADLRVGHGLRVAMGGLFFQFSVAGGSEALSALTQCVIRFAHLPLKGNTGVLEGTFLDSKSRSKEAEELANLIISYSRVQKPQSEKALEDRPDSAPDAAWVIDALVTTSIKIVDGQNQLREITYAVVGARYEACPTGFFFIMQSEEISGQEIGRIYDSCQTTNGISASYDFIFPRPNRGYYVINEAAQGSSYIVVGFKLLRAYELNLRSVIPVAIQNMSRAPQ
jgi:hypothetical protein